MRKDILDVTDDEGGGGTGARDVIETRFQMGAILLALALAGACYPSGGPISPEGGPIPTPPPAVVGR